MLLPHSRLCYDLDHECSVQGNPILGSSCTARLAELTSPTYITSAYRSIWLIRTDGHLLHMLNRQRNQQHEKH
jgi:hypothetical protein